MARRKTSTTTDYAVGYGRPPVKNRFQKGRSGNPRGRPKGSRNLITLLADELDQPVAIREGDKLRRLPKRQALVTGLLNRALKGDARAASLVFQLADRQSAASADSSDTSLSAEDQAIFDDLLARMKGDPERR